MKHYNSPLSLQRLHITDDFWKREIDLVREEMIPYQWRALNDELEDAEPSFCIRNFRVAVRQNQERQKKGKAYIEPQYTFRGFQTLPDDMEHLEDKFYGFVFQDSDLYKWIEAASYSLADYPSPDLEKLVDEAVELICGAQQEDGYLDTYYIINGRNQAFTNLRDHHELYCFGHLAESAVAYYEATGKDKLLGAARRFADYIDLHFGREEGKRKGYPGHEIAEMALVRLYEVTGEKRYLDLAGFFVDERGQQPYYFDLERSGNNIGQEEDRQLRYQYYQAHLPVRQQDEAVGHAVRAVYLYSGMADLARLREDKSLLEACERLWEDITNRKMYITGGIGGTHIGESFSFPYDLPNDTAYAETCASVGLVFFARRMIQIRPDAKYADIMERAIYNGVLSGVSLDGKSFFYVNPLEVVPKACELDERKFHIKAVRQKWFGCACCPPNLARLVGSIGSYAYTEKEHILYVHLYLGSVIDKEIDGQRMQIVIESGYPWDGKATVQVRGTDKPFTIAFRIPGWCDGICLGGREDIQTIEKDGYLYVTKVWEEEDMLQLEFPMRVRFLEADTRVREDIGKVAVMRGPIVYCLEEADNGENLHLLTVRTDGVPEVFDKTVEGVSVKAIRVQGFRQAEAPVERELYHDAGNTMKQPVQLQFIPYFTWANRGRNEMQVWTRRE